MRKGQRTPGKKKSFTQSSKRDVSLQGATLAREVDNTRHLTKYRKDSNMAKEDSIEGETPRGPVKDVEKQGSGEKRIKGLRDSKKGKRGNRSDHAGERKTVSQ